MKGLDKIIAGRVRLLFTNPFFGVLATDMKVVETDKVPTAGVDGVHLFFNPKFTDTLSKGEIEFVLAHEVLHLVFLTHLRRGFRDAKVWNEACITLDNSILMGDNTTKKLYEIEPGDYVMSPDGPNKVLGVAYNGEREVGLLNNSLRCTNDHKILTSEGFKGAESCRNRQIYIHSETRDEASGARQLLDVFSIPTSRTDRDQIQDSCGISAEERIKGRQICDEAHESGPINGAGEGGFGILRGTGRRGRNNLSVPDKTKRQGVHEAPFDSDQYILFSSEVFGEAGILWDRIDQQFRQPVLEDPTERILSSGVPGEIGALPHNKETGVSGSNSNMRRACKAAKERKSDSSHVKACRGSESFKLEKGLFQEREGDIQPVFDLITEKGLYIAEGIVVHNCDYAINQILKDENFTLIQGCLIDEKFRDWSSEKIYEYLMENPEEQAQGEEWNVGAVSDAPGAGEQASPAKIKELEAEMNGKTQAAAMSARKAGKMPGQLESIISDICAPKADWRDILQRFVSEKAMLDYNFALCHTRMLQQYGIINPVLDGEKLGEVAILVDTSGSVTDEELAQFAGEINDIIENYECRTTVVYCDTQVNRVDVFEGDEPITMHAVGRGGTIQAPGYEYIRDNILSPACLIHYSDGEVFDWGDIEHPGCPAILACNMPTVPDDTPDWLEVVDIT